MELFVYGDANLCLVQRGNNQVIKVKTSENKHIFTTFLYHGVNDVIA